MEGLFNYEAGTKEEYLKEIREGKEKLRICSFSKDPKNLLLWSHYADGFKGICIEVKVNNSTPDFEIAKVSYTPDRGGLFSSEGVRILKGVMPRLLLSLKAKDWSVEKEVRLLSEKQYLKHGIKITGILLGLRTPDILKETLIKLAEPDVKIWETKIGDANQIVIGKQVDRTANELGH
jgi:hypothetical protein